ncbi:MAG: hypothetical protein ACOX6K_04275 [Sphaerochaetaceae bacterium]|jgi:hypothetical protein
MRNKKTITLAMVLVIASAALFASGASETDKLWFHADEAADASSVFLPGTRIIEMTTFDASGAALETSGATVYQTPVNYGRYLENRIVGDGSIVDLLGRFFDGGVITPFEDNLYDIDYSVAGTEILDGRVCTVYEVELAMDKALLTYDPNYQASGDIIGWDSSNEDFDDTLLATVWIDQDTKAIVKLVNEWKIDDGISSGKLAITQTVDYTVSTVDGTVVSLPSSIATDGRLTQRQDGSGYYTITDFSIKETQSDFFHDAKFARGESVD